MNVLYFCDGYLKLWGCSSVGRALESHSRGRGFDSLQLHFVRNTRQEFAQPRQVRKEATVSKFPGWVSPDFFISINLFGKNFFNQKTT